jgi:hypothetical protein
MKIHSRMAIAIITIALTVSANADPIEIVGLTGGDHPTTLGGYDMTLLTPPASGDQSCTEALSSELICFEDENEVGVTLTAGDPSWWQYAHGNIFIVHGYHWIDLVLPSNTRAISLFVGASMNGRAWIQATDGTYTTPQEHFPIANGNTRGYGIYATGCEALTRVTVEPWEWGFGYLAINQGDCQSVPEPGTLALLGLGLLGMALARRTQRSRQLIT